MVAHFEIQHFSLDFDINLSRQISFRNSSSNIRNRPYLPIHRILISKVRQITSEEECLLSEIHSHCIHRRDERFPFSLYSLDVCCTSELSLCTYFESDPSNFRSESS